MKSSCTGKYSNKKSMSDGNAFAQVLDHFSKTEKTLKNVHKSTSPKKKRHHNSDGDSDSE